MKLTEIIDYVMLDTGQWIVGDIENINLDKKKFWLIVNRALGIYDKFKPITKKIPLFVSSSPYIFGDDEAPEWISKMYPSGVMSNFNLFGFGASSGDPIPIVFRYDKPKLYFANASSVEITGHYKRKVIFEYNTPDDVASGIKDVDIPDMDVSDYKFIKLITGYFLVAVGRSRRAFTVSDFPINMDSEQLISEGNILASDIEDSLSETSSWYYAIGG